VVLSVKVLAQLLTTSSKAHLKRGGTLNEINQFAKITNLLGFSMTIREL